MHVLQGLEELIHDVLFVYLLKDVGSNHSMQISLHVLKYKVDVPVIFCFQYVQQPARSKPCTWAKSLFCLP